MCGTSGQPQPDDGYTREEVNCNICGLKDEELLFHIPERVVRCRRCGLVYLSPRLDSSSLEKIYTKEYFVSSCNDPGVDYPAYADYIGDEGVIVRSMHRRMKKVEQYAAAKGHLLDVGCAAGFSLLAARQRGWEAAGIEFSAFCADYARRRGLNVHHGSLADYPGRDGSFDAITMWDYLEHSADPLYDLKRCAQLLKKGGVIVCSIPNIDSWSYRVFRENWIGFKNIEHFYYYSRSTLGRLANLAGLRMTNSYYLGKYLSLSFFLSRVQYYTSCRPLLAGVEKVANTALAKKMSFYINPFDILNVVLRKEQ